MIEHSAGSGKSNTIAWLAHRLSSLHNGQNQKIFDSVIVKRSHQDNISFFAFTATPKHKTLKIFGRNGEPFHRYTMRQAIEVRKFIAEILGSEVYQRLSQTD